MHQPVSGKERKTSNGSAMVKARKTTPAQVPAHTVRTSKQTQGTRSVPVKQQAQNRKKGTRHSHNQQAHHRATQKENNRGIKHLPEKCFQVVKGKKGPVGTKAQRRLASPPDRAPSLQAQQVPEKHKKTPSWVEDWPIATETREPPNRVRAKPTTKTRKEQGG